MQLATIVFAQWEAYVVFRSHAHRHFRAALRSYAKDTAVPRPTTAVSRQTSGRSLPPSPPSSFSLKIGQVFFHVLKILCDYDCLVFFFYCWWTKQCTGCRSYGRYCIILRTGISSRMIVTVWNFQVEPSRSSQPRITHRTHSSARIMPNSERKLTFS